MYVVTVSASFEASHCIRLRDGGYEPRHAHRWMAEARFVGLRLDETGVLVDFTVARARLGAITDVLSGTHLNEWSILSGASPSAEHVARAIFDRLGADPDLAPHLQSVTVTEAPGCTAAYVRDTPNPDSQKHTPVDDNPGCQ